jgi:selenocysteine lyase/cysteine desulfurase
MELTEAQALWRPEGVYCNTASFGLPPDPAWDAMQAALADWRGGRTSWEAWGEATDVARGLFARMVGVDASAVTVSGTIAELVGVLATALPAGARVVVPEIEFTSTLFPLLVQERLEVVTVPVSGLADAVADGADAVAFAAVQMSNGEVADLDAIAAAAAASGAITIVDATQAAGWLPLDATRFDAVLASAYKWLVSPRGSAFAAVSERLLDRVTPHNANWFAGADVHSSYFGPPLRLAATARRLDVSPAWFTWVATAPALQVLLDVGVDVIHEHNLGLANRMRSALGLPDGNSAIVSAELPGAEERLAAAGIIAASRGGRLRVSWHLYNTGGDVDRLLDVVAG